MPLLPTSKWLCRNITTTTTTTTVLWPFVRDYPGKPVTEETFTDSHLSWSSTILHQLPRPTVIHSILPVQFMCLTVFLHHLSPGPLWSTSWSETHHLSPGPLWSTSTSYSIHFFSQSLSPFATNAHTIATYFAVWPRLCHLFLISLSLNFLLRTLSLTSDCAKKR